MSVDAVSMCAHAKTEARGLPTWHQAFVLAFILAIRKQRGCSPTLRDISGALGASSSNTASCHLAALKKKGLVKWSGHKSATLVPMSAPSCTACQGSGKTTTADASLVITAEGLLRRRVTQRLCRCCAGTGYTISNPKEGMAFARALLERSGVGEVTVTTGASLVEVSS